MNGYVKIAVVALCMIIISINNEVNKPYISATPSVSEYIHIYIIRYIHYLVYLISSFYLLFFNGIGTTYDIYFYLIVVFSIVLGWYIFDSCWLSYSELLFYNINLEKVETTFHPTFRSIFKNYDDYLMVLSGILYVVNVSILLYYLKPAKIIYKIIYFALFLYLFIDGSIKGRLQTMHYSTKNKQLLFLKNAHDNYIDKLYKDNIK